MKHILTIAIAAIIVLAACKKENPTPGIDTSRTYTVQGRLISKRTDSPRVGKWLALSQGHNPVNGAPYAQTDSTGYFTITYQPGTLDQGLMLHPYYNDYSCVFGDIAILENIPAGQDINLGKIYVGY